MAISCMTSGIAPQQSQLLDNLHSKLRLKEELNIGCRHFCLILPELLQEICEEHARPLVAYGRFPVMAYADDLLMLSPSLSKQLLDANASLKLGK